MSEYHEDRDELVAEDKDTGTTYPLYVIDEEIYVADSRYEPHFTLDDWGHFHLIVQYEEDPTIQ